ncbi:hypothetical protein C8Q76DRAFT_790798 [Earliella scabrosa]|nr:hypothetical protein C8Q76DRAFT_790798 [Earliella scabrosa]
MAALASLLPKPLNAPVVSDDDDDEVLQVQAQQQAGPSQAVIIRQAVPPYGQRRGWKLTSLEDLEDEVQATTEKTRAALDRSSLRGYRHTREEVRQRALMQQKLSEKEKAQKQENLRLLAQRAREERAGIAPRAAEAAKPSAERTAAMQSFLIALGLAKPTLSKESTLDSRLFNQESLSGSFADDDACNLYDCPLFHGSSAAAAIYKARGNISEGNQDSFGGGTEEGIGKALETDRFELGAPRVGFEGANEQEVREGPVQFEKDSGDVFGLNKFLDEATSGRKRGLDTEVGGSRNRQ